MSGLPSRMPPAKAKMACSYPAAVANQWISHGICCIQGPEETRPCGTCVCDDSFFQSEIVAKLKILRAHSRQKGIKKEEEGKWLSGWTQTAAQREGVLLRLGPVLRILWELQVPSSAKRVINACPASLNSLSRGRNTRGTTPPFCFLPRPQDLSLPSCPRVAFPTAPPHSSHRPIASPGFSSRPSFPHPHSCRPRFRFLAMRVAVFRLTFV